MLAGLGSQEPRIELTPSHLLERFFWSLRETGILLVRIGIGNARAYVLAHVTDDETETNYDFVMRQGSPASEYLLYEKWRLALGVTENIPGEVRTGGISAPPDDRPPFPRLYKPPNAVGGQWILSPSGGAAIRRVDCTSLVQSE